MPARRGPDFFSLTDGQRFHGNAGRRGTSVSNVFRHGFAEGGKTVHVQAPRLSTDMSTVDL